MRVLALADAECVSRDFNAQFRQTLVRMGLDVPACPTTQLASWRRIWNEAEVFVLALPSAVERGLRTLEEMARENDGSRRIVVLGPPDGKLVLRALRMGAAYYVDMLELEPELEETLRLVRDEAEQARSGGRVIAVLSPSGGSGASTIAVNLAASLAQQHGRTALLDLKLGAGVLDALLDLQPQHHLGDFCRMADGLDRNAFERMLAAHSCGVRLLAAPLLGPDVLQVTPEGVRLAVAWARNAFENVVLDVDRTAANEQLAALQEADLILLAVRLDFASIRNIQQTLRTLEECGVDPERIRLVANRHGQPRELPREKAEIALGTKFFQLIPDDPAAVHDAHHDGIPLAVSQPKSRIARSFQELSKNVAVWQRTGSAQPLRGEFGPCSSGEVVRPEAPVARRELTRLAS